MYFINGANQLVIQGVAYFVDANPIGWKQILKESKIHDWRTWNFDKNQKYIYIWQYWD
jgi:hypothetical protein